MYEACKGFKQYGVGSHLARSPTHRPFSHTLEDLCPPPLYLPSSSRATINRSMAVLGASIYDGTSLVLLSTAVRGTGAMIRTIDTTLTRGRLHHILLLCIMYHHVVMSI